jgi:hypothetical protein
MSASIRIHDHVRSVIDPDGAVLLDLKQGKYYSLNGIGAEIWRNLEAGLSAPEIEDRLASLYDAPAEVLRGDVVDFIGDLQRKRLVDAGA